MLDWSSWDVRNFCIHHNYYTCGDNVHYSAMLNFVDTHKPLDRNLKLVALDIVSNSEGKSIFNKGDVAEIKNYLWLEVVKDMLEEE